MYLVRVIVILYQYGHYGEINVYTKMAKSIARNVVKEYLEVNTELSGKDLEKGASIILVYLKLGMIKVDDVEFEKIKTKADNIESERNKTKADDAKPEKSKIKTIRKIYVKDNSVLLTDKKKSSSLSPNSKHSVVRMETPSEKLKRLLEQR